MEDQFQKYINKVFHDTYSKQIERFVRIAIEKELSKYRLSSSISPRERFNKKRNIYDKDTGRKVGSVNIEMLCRDVLNRVSVRFKGLVARNKADAVNFTKIESEVHRAILSYFRKIT